MGANAKQQDSNILSAEAYTGQCPVLCEQCYVNFGYTGRTSCTAIVSGDSPEAVEARRRAKKMGWDGRSEVIWHKVDSEWYYNGPRLVRLKTGYIVPSVLRISTLGDSSIARKKWCEEILELWGPHCFFNSTIRILKTRSRNLREVFHKVVVTANGGFQHPYLLPPPPKGKEKWPKTIKTASVYASAAMGSMNPRTNHQAFAPFNEPKTLSNIGLAEEEDKVKFYRLRVLPGVEPRFETDAPIVYTILRFKGIQDFCEFARRYELELRYEGSDAYAREVARYFGFKTLSVKCKEGEPNRVFISGDVDWNVSPNRGEWVEFNNIKSWWRMADPSMVDHLPFVCDTRYLGCKACGLCATLDGTEPGGINPIMAEYGFEPIPFSRTYLEKKKVSRNPDDDEVDVGSLSEDFFGDILKGVFVKENPGERIVTIEQDKGWIIDALKELNGYIYKLDYYVDGWDTHEDASALLAYCFWALLRKARRANMGAWGAWQWCRNFCVNATGSDLFEANPDLMLVWNGQGPMIEEFGPLG